MKDNSNKPLCLIIDDDTELCELLDTYFSDKFSPITVGTKADALETLKKAKDLAFILCDLKLPDGTGLEVLSEAAHLSIGSPIVMITAEGSKESAIESIKRGAYDYIAKPLDFNELSIVVDRAVRYFDLKNQNEVLQQKLARTSRFGDLIGKSKKMQDLYEIIRKVADSPANVLINGESGSGKEMVARSIHFQGSRKNKSFVPVNCSAIPKELMESELFGHKKGSFTGAMADRTGLFKEADGGSIFLDEIGDMPLDLQVKILRVLQEKKIKPVGASQEIPVDVRVIAATHRDLKEMVSIGEFREDLFFRLNVIPISVPSLRERKEDIPLLAQLFLQKYKDHNPKVEGLTSEAEAKLCRLRWTGNVRELENTIERAITLCSGNLIGESDLATDFDSGSSQQISNLFTQLPTLKQLEQEYLQYVLMAQDGKKEKSAEILGIDRKTLYRKIKDYGL